MRTILLATALVALAPFAIAQTYPPGSTTLAPSHGTTYSPNGRSRRSLRLTPAAAR